MQKMLYYDKLSSTHWASQKFLQNRNIADRLPENSHNSFNKNIKDRPKK